ncbi:uncharacterized protein LOC124173283 [Ischnura elegans]|uniref:uncharacterized protein LOC124173283 n=1 Tax=Ischnura elegans TaxID=197161 RepID=UPI001ED8833E|nr:uncharacterized protein LOC124173283 [Ischnura elegans]
MWRHFGIDAENASCIHPVNALRRLWFSSDFPHLIKNVRNFFVKNEETWTPDGIVKLKHWEAIVKLGNPCGFQLKACPDLTMDHIHPKPYQKMNVRRAFQFFGGKVAAAMQVYKGRHDGLEDCDASIKIIQRFQVLIQSLNSRTQLSALRKGSENWNVSHKL